MHAVKGQSRFFMHALEWLVCIIDRVLAAFLLAALVR
jgi:hypothetical protein